MRSRRVLCGLLLLLPAIGRAAQFQLTWDANAESDLAGYKVYYDTDSGPPYEGTQANEGASPIDVPLSALGDPTHPSFVITGMPSCTKFYFAVTAYNTANLESGYSNEVSLTAIAAPAVVSATPSGAEALLVAWSDLPSDDHGAIPTYRVYYDTDGGTPYTGTGADQGDSPVVVTTASLADPHAPEVLLTGLRAGQLYYFAVESVCGDGTSKLSPETTGTPEAAPDAGPPQLDGGRVDAGGDGPRADAAGGGDGGGGDGHGGGGGGDGGGGDGGGGGAPPAGKCGCRAGGGGGGFGWLLALAALLHRASCARAGRRKWTRACSRRP